MAVRRECGTCRHFHRSPVRSLGWCTNPKRRGLKERQVVNRSELACNRVLFDLWEPRRPGLFSPSRLPGLHSASRLPPLRLPALAGLLALVGGALGLLFLLTAFTFSTLFARPQATATPTSVLAAAPPPAPTPTPAVVWVKIGNTDGLGAYLRPEPSLQARGVVAWPDGTVLEIVGPDRQFDGKIWRNVKDSRGNVGWILKEYLLPAE